MDSPAQQIPERILNSLICQQCFCYLTVLPIDVLPNGHQICGRCIGKKYPKNSKPFCLLEEHFIFDGTYNIPVALLGYMSYKSVFPCINKLEGCQETFKLEDIEAHEELCVYKKIQCVLCKFRGVGTQIVNHFKCFHHKFHEREGLVTLNLKNNFSDTILYKLADLLLFIEIEFQPDIRHISFRISCISDVQCFGFARLIIRAKCGRPNECMQLEVLSEKIALFKGSVYHISVKTDDFHFMDSSNLVCAFKLLSDSRNQR